MIAGIWMPKTTRHQRRKRIYLLSKANGGVHEPRKKTETSPSPKSSKPPNIAIVQVATSKLDRSKDSGQELNNTTHHHKHGGENGARGATQPRGQVAKDRTKKRARSHTEEIEEVVEGVEWGQDELALEASSDELVATIQGHDRFFSLMLDMIPESLVLPAKQVSEPSYASKYMKVTDGVQCFRRLSRLTVVLV